MPPRPRRKRVQDHDHLNLSALALELMDHFKGQKASEGVSDQHARPGGLLIPNQLCVRGSKGLQTGKIGHAVLKRCFQNRRSYRHIRGKLRWS
jgi:hypothetical protein